MQKSLLTVDRNKLAAMRLLPTFRGVQLEAKVRALIKFTLMTLQARH